MKKINNAIYVNQDFVCGIFYYAIEYLDYLLKNKIDFFLLLNGYYKSFYKLLISDKYDINKLHPKIFDKIIFFDSNIYNVTNLIILDSTTFKRKNRIIFKNLFYNYGNDLDSRKKPLKRKDLKKVKIITFGDKELNLKVDYHYPLCLNYSIFRNKEDIMPFKNKEFNEVKKDNMDKSFKARYEKNFHSQFDTLIFKGEDVWDRANRLIPECKFYGKKIIYEPKLFLDSTKLRFERNWDYYDIWKFKSFDTNLSFADWLKTYLNK